MHKLFNFCWLPSASTSVVKLSYLIFQGRFLLIQKLTMLTYKGIWLQEGQGFVEFQCVFYFWRRFQKCLLLKVNLFTSRFHYFSSPPQVSLLFYHFFMNCFLFKTVSPKKIHLSLQTTLESMNVFKECISFLKMSQPTHLRPFPFTILWFRYVFW